MVYKRISFVGRNNFSKLHFNGWFLFVKVFTLKLLVIFNFGAYGVMLAITMLVFHGNKRTNAVGWICAAFNLAVFASPLSIMVLSLSCLLLLLWTSWLKSQVHGSISRAQKTKNWNSLLFPLSQVDGSISRVQKIKNWNSLPLSLLPLHGSISRAQKQKNWNFLPLLSLKLMFQSP